MRASLASSKPRPSASVRVCAAATEKQDLTKPLPNFCKDCKWFKCDPHYRSFFTGKPTEQGYSFGKCTRHGRINLVSGTVEYEYAEIAREYTCKGDHFCGVSPPRDD